MEKFNSKFDTRFDMVQDWLERNNFTPEGYTIVLARKLLVSKKSLKPMAGSIHLSLVGTLEKALYMKKTKLNLMLHTY